MYIEVLFLLIIFLVFFIWSVWFNYSKRKLLKKYNPNNDKGRKAEEQRPSGGRIGAIENKEFITPGSPEPSERSLLPTTEIIPVGKDSNNNRKGFRKVFRFFKKRK